MADMSLLNELRANFPWLDQIGFSPEFFQELVASSASGDEIVTKLRQQPQYKQRFPGLWRQDGSIRMTEAQYLQTESNLRQVLNQYGYGDQYTSPQALVGFFDSEIDPSELKDRLDVYRQVTTSGQSVKDAFYVYAGLDLSDDDLYAAAVDPAAAQRLRDEYNSRTAGQAFDYTTWITRATEVGLSRVAQTLEQLKTNGAVTGTAVQSVLNVDPNFARQIMDALYTGGSINPTETLNLSELLSSFEQAAIGAAATNAGLALPTKERIQQIRAAGIDRAKAQQTYMQFGQSKGVWEAAVQRTGGGNFTQSDLEDAAFLGDAQKANALSVGLAREEAAGVRQGSFQFDQNRQGRLVQQGLR